VNLGRKRPELAVPEIQCWLDDAWRRHVVERALELI
jgi:hypothetical protein